MWEITLESRQFSAEGELYKYSLHAVGMDRAFNCSQCGARRGRTGRERKQRYKGHLSSIISASVPSSGLRSSDIEMSTDY